MTGIDVNVSKELLPGLLSSQDGLSKLVEVVLNQILDGVGVGVGVGVVPF